MTTTRENSNTEDKAFDFAHFAPGVQQIFLNYLNQDVSINTVSSPPYPHQGLRLFNNQEVLSLSEVADQFVLWGGEPEELKALITKHPFLLDCVTIGVDPAGRKIQGTLYQKALGAGDFEMINMIKTFLTKDEERKQRKEQFPPDWNKTTKIKRDANLAALKEVITAIRNAESSDDLATQKKICKPAIDQFKKYLAAENEKPITSGFHFDIEFLQTAIEQLDLNVESWGGRISEKRNVYCQQVFGSIERRVSARDAHEIIRGLKHYDEKNPAQRRLIYDKNTPFYAKAANGSEIGVNRMANIYGELSPTVLGKTEPFTSYVNRKKQLNNALIPAQSNEEAELLPRSFPCR